jgi:hypothetical protein
VDSSCTAAHGCGFNALISEYGTYAPYTAWFVSDNIAWNQNDHFSNNTYTGPWEFQAWSQNNNVTWAQWSGNVASGDKCAGSGERQSGVCSGPFGQDAGSTFNSTALPTATPSATVSTMKPRNTLTLQPRRHS